MSKKKSILLYTDQYKSIRTLTDADAGKLFKAIYEYHIDGEVDLEWMPEFAFNMLVPIFENNISKYEAKCAKNKENALKRWQGNECERIETHTNYADKEKDKEKEKGKEKNKELREEAIRFIDKWNEIFKREHTATKDFINAYITLRRDYTNDDIKKWLWAYYWKNKTRVDDIEWRDNYYLTPIKFIKQKNNWLISYL